jgi:hypothetical protein
MELEDCRHLMAGGQRTKLFVPAVEKWLTADHEPISPHLE